MSQPAFEGMPQRLYPAAPSRLTTYLDCPRRYRLGYLERPAPSRGAPWAHHSVGAAVHTALARWWDLPRDRRTPAGGGDLLSACWLTAGFRDDAQQAAVRDRTRSQVERDLAGIERRLEKVGGDINRDRARMWEVEQAEMALREAEQRRPAEAAALLDVRWMIEELRVSLFAQSLGTAQPVSLQRILRALEP